MLRRATVLSACFIAFFTPSPASAQLRPLEPAQWRLLRESSSVLVQAGASRLLDQRASLAGETGDLWEAGNFAVAWQTGRVVLEAGGTAQRFFRMTGRFDIPYADVEPADDNRRHDSGDYRISTTVRLTPETFPFTGIARFGTRLPTTDNTTGLDRDAVDFFASIGASGLVGPVMLSGETGLGIHSTREQRFEQDDLLLYALSAAIESLPVVPSIMVIGQQHGTTHSAIRGVENLGELRLGLRFGVKKWVKLDLVKGYETFSPSAGVVLTMGWMH